MLLFGRKYENESNRPLSWFSETRMNIRKPETRRFGGGFRGLDAVVGVESGGIPGTRYSIWLFGQVGFVLSHR